MRALLTRLFEAPPAPEAWGAGLPAQSRCVDGRPADTLHVHFLARKWHGATWPPRKIKAQASGYPPADLGLSHVLRLVGADGFEPPTSAL